MRGILTGIVAAFIVALAAPIGVGAEFDVPAGFEDRLEVGGLGAPTALAWLPETPEQGDLLIATQGGHLYRSPAPGEKAEILDLSEDLCVGSETGLLGLAVDPAFRSGDRFLYLYYTFRKPSGACVNRVSKFTMNEQDVVGNEQVLIDNIPARGGNHNGGDLQFDHDGLLYVSVGDGGVDLRTGASQDGNGNARRLDLLNGKILRIARDGSVPASNPFRGKRSVRCAKSGQAPSRARAAHVDQEKKPKKGKPHKRKGRGALRCQEIFATGLRNPFRIAFDDSDTQGAQRFYINDVGGSGFEEIDVGQRGADYGWNRREGPCPTGQIANDCRADSDFVEPLFAYGHGHGSDAVDDCNVITGGAFAPSGGDWPADYLFADFGCERLFALDERADPVQATVFAEGIGSSSGATHLAFGTDGALYYATSAAGGQVRKIVDLPPG
ncbi:MAG: PQQ-dependent sugar dehydrogenase [Thermomicrobiales bacterium]